MPFLGRTGISSSPWLWVVALALFLPSSLCQMPVPSAGQLCISDCSTCPVVCTAPPPPLRAYSTYIPPPPLRAYSTYIPPPPRSYSTYIPPPPPALPSYFFWGPPPPVANYVLGGQGQPSGQMPQTVGPRDYSYPYYYFYSSNSCSFSYISTFLLVLSASLFHCVF